MLKKMGRVLFVLVLFGALAAGLVLVRKNQETRRGAFFSTGTVIMNSSVTNLTVNQEVLMDLKVDVGDKKLVAIDVRVNFDKDKVQVLEVTPDYGNSSSFIFRSSGDIFANTFINAEGKLMLSGAVPNSLPETDLPTGVVNLGKVKFKAINGGSAMVSLNTTDSMGVASTTGADPSIQLASAGIVYLVSGGGPAPTSTPAPSSVPPTPTPTYGGVPTATPTVVVPTATPTAAVPTSTPTATYPTATGVVLPTLTPTASGVRALACERCDVPGSSGCVSGYWCKSCWSGSTYAGAKCVPLGQTCEQAFASGGSCFSGSTTPMPSVTVRPTRPPWTTACSRCDVDGFVSCQTGYRCKSCWGLDGRYTGARCIPVTSSDCASACK